MGKSWLSDLPINGNHLAERIEVSEAAGPKKGQVSGGAAHTRKSIPRAARVVAYCRAQGIRCPQRWNTDGSQGSGSKGFGENGIRLHQPQYFRNHRCLPGFSSQACEFVVWRWVKRAGRIRLHDGKQAANSFGAFADL